MTSSAAEGPQTVEAVVEADVAMAEADKKRPAEAAIEQELATDTPPLAIVSSGQVQVPLDIGSSSGTVPALAISGTAIPGVVTIPTPQ